MKNILAFPQLIKFETAKFIHRYINKKVSTIFDSYCVLAKITHSHIIQDFQII